MSQLPARQPTPWVVPDLFRWFGLLALGAVGLVVAWWGASGTTKLNGLITWVNVGGAALIVSGLGNMTWLLQGRRAVATRRRQLLPAASFARSEPALLPPYGDDDVRVAVKGATRHHAPGCAAVVGKKVERLSVARHEKAGRRPCGLCER